MGNPITDRMKIGAVGELLVQLRLLEYGVQAAPPLKDTGNDLIAVREEVFRGIQIKTTAFGKRRVHRLPEHYHVLALVHLCSSDVQVLLDQCEIYLLPRSVVERNHGRAPKDLSQFRISQTLVDSIFPQHGR